MKINVDNLDELEFCGVYKISNCITNKYYIGSTKQKLRLRLNHHLQALRKNNHKNTHLQNAWNKYGEDNFEFSILEICDKNVVYNREQHYLDNRDLSLCYNINPNATGFSDSVETRQHLSKAHHKYNSVAAEYYHKFKNNLITIDDIPAKYQNSVRYWLNYQPWNKNKTYSTTDHLKVKHRLTDKLKAKCANFSEQRRCSAETVYVYDSNWNFIDCFRSSKDLEDLSLSLDLPINSRFKKKRGNCELNKLQSCNINRAIKLNTTYKGLYFKNKPLHQGIDDANEPKSVKSWNANTEVNTELKNSVSPYSIETETVITE